MITKKPVVAEEYEIRTNARSRSAKLGVFERVSPGHTCFVRKVNKQKQNGLTIKSNAPDIHAHARDEPYSQG